MQRFESLTNGIFRSCIHVSIVRGQTDAARATTRLSTNPEASAAASVAGTGTPCVCLPLNVATLADLLSLRVDSLRLVSFFS